MLRSCLLYTSPGEEQEVGDLKIRRSLAKGNGRLEEEGSPAGVLGELIIRKLAHSKLDEVRPHLVEERILMQNSACLLYTSRCV